MKNDLDARLERAAQQVGVRRHITIEVSFLLTGVKVTLKGSCDEIVGSGEDFESALRAALDEAEKCKD